MFSYKHVITLEGMFQRIRLNIFKYEVRRNVQQNTFRYQLVCYPFSTTTKVTPSTSSRSKYQYIKKCGYLLGACVTFSLAYMTYEWTVRVPICPNFNRNQTININNVFSCTALVKDINEACSGRNPMKKIGAITGVNYKLVHNHFDKPSAGVHILLNDEEISRKNLFDINYMLEYINTMADLLLKLDESHRFQVLTNIIGYYVFVCPECRSSSTRQMLSCTVYLYDAGLQNSSVNISEIASTKTQT